jgi:hypothetical protein
MIEPDPADDYAIATDLDLDIVIVWKFDRGTGKLLTPETFPPVPARATSRSIPTVSGSIC